MTPPRTLAPRRIGRRLSWRLVLLQTALALAVMLLVALWLQIPDAGAVDVVGSVLLGLLTIVAAGAGESWLVLWLAGRAWSTRRAIFVTGLWIAAALLWWAWSAWMARLSDHTYLYASFLNSRLPHGLRVPLSFGRMETAMNWLWTTLAWSAGGLLAVPVVAILLSTGPVKATRRVLVSVSWWLLLLVGTDVGVYATAALLHWVPGRKLGAEITGLLLRLLVVVTLDGLIVSGLLKFVVDLVQRGEPLQTVPEGTPLASQPRTAENP